MAIHSWFDQPDPSSLSIESQLSFERYRRSFANQTAWNDETLIGCYRELVTRIFPNPSSEQADSHHKEIAFLYTVPRDILENVVLNAWIIWKVKVEAAENLKGMG